MTLRLEKAREVTRLGFETESVEFNIVFVVIQEQIELAEALADKLSEIHHAEGQCLLRKPIHNSERPGNGAFCSWECEPNTCQQCLRLLKDG